MLKRFLAAILSFALIVTSMPVLSADLSAAISNLGGPVTSVNAPGRYQSAARDVYSAGGFDMRTPAMKNSAQLFSFTPPHIDAGCGGISAFFGGFSFISGKEFEQLLKNMASGAAMGFVAHLAMKALCPYCESVVQFLQRINQAASQSAKDSCAWGKQMAQSFMDKTGTSNGFGFEAECAAIAPKTGGAKDAKDAEGGICATAFGAVEALEKYVADESKKTNGSANPADSNGVRAQLPQLGNQMWLATGRMFPNSSVDSDLQVLRMWLMNLTGTTLVGTGDKVSCGGTVPSQIISGKEHPQMQCPGSGEGTVSAEDIMQLMLCGASPPTPVQPSHANITTYCAESNKLGNVNSTDRTTRKVMVCDPARNDDKACSHILMVELKDARSPDGTPLIQGTGLMYQVRDLLGEAVRRVIDNKAVYAGDSDPVGARIVNLIQVAPYPLYQAINAAAVYPNATLDLIDSMSLLIGESLAYSYLDEYLRLAGRSETGAVVDAMVMRGISAAVEKARAKGLERKSLIVQNMTIQESLAANIRQINMAIQKQVMTTDVMNSNKFTATMGGSITSSNMGGGGKTVAP